MKLKLTIFSLFLLQIAFAQVPGYMGKRMTIGYSNNLFPSILGPNATNYDVGINTTHSFNLEYTIKNRTNLCVSYQMFNTGVTTNNTFVDQTSDMYGNYNTVEYTYSPEPKVPMKLHSNNICVGFKFFGAGTLAPIGKYKKLEFVLMLTDLTYGAKSFSGIEQSSFGGGSGVVRKSGGTGNYNFKSFAFTYTIGRQRVLFNCLVVDYGIQFGFVPPAVITVLDSENDYSTFSSASVENVLSHETQKRLFRYEAINLHLGLGFLAF